MCELGGVYMYKLIDKKGLVIKTSEKLKELHDVAVEKMNEEQGDSTFIQIAPKDGYVIYIENENGDIAYKIEDTEGKFDKIPVGLFGEVSKGDN